MQNLGLMAVLYLYLKFMVIWRIFRCWALLDGIETYDNMEHCIMSSQTFTEFWRNWHKSFNQFLIRYLYIPLGGNKYK